MKSNITAFDFKKIICTLMFAAFAVPASGFSEEILEEVVITGSRIVRKDLESVSPVTVISAEEIKQTGVNRIEDVLNQIPQIETSSTAFDSNGATGNATLNLRGLGSNRTLVLLNGRRLQSGGLNSIAPDINQIPIALIKNVEVLTGGASTVYGSDAIAGVVNFELNNKFEGIQLSANTSGYQHDNYNPYMQSLLDSEGYGYQSGNTTMDGRQYSVDMVIGSKIFNESAHFVMYGGYRKINALLQGSRDYSSCGLSGDGSICEGSYTAGLPNFDLYGYKTDSVNGKDIIDESNNLFLGLQSDGALSDTNINLYNYSPVGYYQRPDKRKSLGGFAEFKINDRFAPYFDFNYMQDETIAQIAESGTFYKDELKMRCGSPLLSAGQSQTICSGLYGTGFSPNDSFAVYVGKRNTEGGLRQSQLSHKSLRLAAGLKGSVTNSWTYDLFYQRGSVDSTEVFTNELRKDKVRDALDVVLNGSVKTCASGNVGCIPYEVFTPAGITVDQVTSLSSTGMRSGYVRQSIMSGYLSGNVPLIFSNAVNPVAVVVGLEHRKEVYETQSDYLFEQGLLLGQGGPVPSVYGSFTMKEAFAESVIPLIENKPLAESLALELGLRSTSNSVTGNAIASKIGINYRPHSQIKFRAMYNRAIRTPDAYELFQPQSLGLWQGADNCAGTTPKYTAAQCNKTGLKPISYGNAQTENSAGQYNGLSGGQLAVKPEEADTYTIGLVFTPYEKFSLTFDYWDIKADGYLGSPSPELVIDSCAETGNNKFCSLIHRSASGSLWAGDGYVDQLTTNLGFKHYTGLDLSTDYSFPVWGGSIDFKYQMTSLFKKFTQEIEGLSSSEVECAGKFSSSCFPSPKWRHNTYFIFNSDSFWSAGLRWRYYSAISNLDSAVTGLNSRISSQSYFDLPVTFNLGTKSSLNIGINNVWDRDPPLVGGDVNPNNANSYNNYDTLGRYIYANFTIKL